MSNIEIPDIIEPLIGWRLWHSRDCGMAKGILRSFSYSTTIYEPHQPLKAICTRYKIHDAPNLDCTCGIYAVKYSHDLMRTIWGAPMGFALLGGVVEDYIVRQFLVLGRIKIWGRVIETKLGYRAEYGYPNELYVHKSYSPLRDYGVPVNILGLEGFADLLAAHSYV